MDNREIEQLLRDSAIGDAFLPQNRESLKNALISLHRPNRQWRKVRLWIIPSILLGCFCIATTFLLIIDDNNQPGPTNNLGGIWFTFTDSAQGRNSTIWPPVSESCENLFVKSAPGFGGKGYAVRIKGIAGVTGDAYLGVNTYLNEKASCPHCIGIDLRGYNGIRFKMKGTIERGNLFFVLPHQSRTPSADRSTCVSLTGYNDYQANITRIVKSDWTDVKLFFKRDFKRLAPVSSSENFDIVSVLEDLKLIQWKWNGDRGQKIDLWIDEVELF